MRRWFKHAQLLSVALALAFYLSRPPSLSLSRCSLFSFLSRSLSVDLELARAQLGLWRKSNRKMQGQATAANRCCLPGCSAPRYVELTTGFVHDFCGRTHSRQAAALGMLGVSTASLQLASQEVDRVWRGRDGEGEYVISLLTNKHCKYQGIKARFLASWHHPPIKPTVMRMYQVRNARQTFAMYSRYKDALVAQSQAQGEKRRGGARAVINEVYHR